MAYTGAGYDPETLDLMTKAFTAVWHEALGQGVPTDDHVMTRSRIAAAICAAVDAGEREQERLKEIALHAVIATPPTPA